MDNKIIPEGEEGWYYRWWFGIYCLMGDEGYKAGLHHVRDNSIAPKMVVGPRSSFRKGGKAVIQSSGFEATDIDYYAPQSPRSATEQAELQRLHIVARENWQKAGLMQGGGAYRHSEEAELWRASAQDQVIHDFLASTN